MEFLFVSDLGTLSERELHVVKLAAQGNTDTKICNLLSISTGTLGTHWMRIKAKSGLATRAELAAAYVGHRCQQSVVRIVASALECALNSGPDCRCRETVRDLPLPVMAVSARGRILLANREAEERLGTRPGQRRSLAELVFGNDAVAIQDALREADTLAAPCHVRASTATPTGVKPFNWLAVSLGTETPATMLVGEEAKERRHKRR